MTVRLMSVFAVLLAVGAVGLTAPASAQSGDALTPFEPLQVFGLEYAADPQLSPDGRHIAYMRVSGDIMRDRFRPTIWLYDIENADHRPLAHGHGSYASPRWSPSGDRLAFIATEDGRSELRAIYLDTQEIVTIAATPAAPRAFLWTPDGGRVVFTMFRPEDPPSPAALPRRPSGASWAEAALVFETTTYRRDGAGYVPPGTVHLYEAPAEGGTPRRLTDETADIGPMTITPDGRSVIVSANFEPGAEADPIESDLYAIDLINGARTRLTDRDGPDAAPAISPDGRTIAYTGFDDRRRGFQVAQLYVVDRDGGTPRSLTADLDRTVRAPAWSPDGRHLYFLFDDAGITYLARTSLTGDREVIARNVGGTSMGRPYPGGSFSVGPDGRVATVTTTPSRPGELTLVDQGRRRVLTALNEDLLGHTEMGRVEAIRTASSVDGLEVEGWLVFPPGFDPAQRYPLLLEIHGGPYANYGPRFSAEMQLYAAAGYVTLYANPRGSTSYGEAFADYIHQAYPGDDHLDLLSLTDAVIERGYIDPDRLYITGGSGGGVLTAWIISATDRFRAAAVAKPVINWASFTLTADISAYVARHWFPGMPWEEPELYWRLSPLSRVGEVDTPTMVMTGEADYRTPSSEAEQYYQALRLRGVPSRLVRLPGAPHGIASRPSHLLAKVAEILAWFEDYDGERRP